MNIRTYGIKLVMSNKLIVKFNILSLAFAFLFIPTLVWSYSNPYKVICTKPSDNQKFDCSKDGIFPETKESFEIPNMPAYKSQDGFGSCRQFSLGTILQKFYCDNKKPKITDCKNPPKSADISSFGLSVYTDNVNGDEFSFDPDAKEELSMPQIIENIQINQNGVITESCRAYDKFVNNFDKTADPVKKKEEFINYLKSVYEKYKGKTEAEVAECPECLAKISAETGIPKDIIKLKNALSKPTYSKFLYTLFFKGCDLEAQNPNFIQNAYPNDKQDVQPVDIKNKVIEIVKSGKPVLFHNLCTDQKPGFNVCTQGHSTVVAGYKKVCKGNLCKDMFKIHNSYGEEWQKLNNDGWMDADRLTENISRVKDQKSENLRLASAAIQWLDPQQ